MKKNLLFIISVFFSICAFAQPVYEWRLENEQLTSSTTYQLDVVMYNKDVNSFEMRGGTAAFMYNNSWIIAGTTPTIAVMNGSYGLPANMQTGATNIATGATAAYFRKIITSVGQGVGFTIAAGTKVKLFTLVITNANGFSTSQTPNFAWKFNSTAPFAVWTYSVGAVATTVVSQTVTASQSSCSTPIYWTGSAWNTYSKTVTNTVAVATPAANLDAVIYSGTLAGALTCRSYQSNSGTIHNLGANSLTVGYNLLDSGILNASTGNINMNGTLANQTNQQTISGLAVGTNNLSLTTPTNVTLGTMVKVYGNLTLATGNIRLKNNHLSIDSTGSIVGNSSAAYIVTDSTGQLEMRGIGVSGKTGAVVFPVGTDSSYNPVSLTNTGVMDNYKVSVGKGIDTAGVLLTTNVVNKKWSIKEETVGGGNLDLIMQWNTLDELPSFTRAASYVSLVDNTGRWIPRASTAALGAGPYTQSLSGITSLSTFGSFGIGSNNALPVKLLTFLGVKKLNSVDLNWKTAVEINAKEFQVERLDLNNKFIQIGKVNASGNSNKVLAYSFNDKDILLTQKVNYYRLKMVDFDGNFKYSNTIKVAENSSKTFVLYPNPTVGKLNIISENINLATASYKITNIIGETVKVGNSSIEEIDVKELSSGIYMVTLTDSNETISVKFVKQ
jgi:hypothetical protein